MPWVTIGGEDVAFIEASHAGTAAFGGRRLYVIRNYRARREEFDHWAWETDSYWRIERRGLEVYDLAGERLGSYELPVPHPAWIRADGKGRLLMKHAGGLEVIDDPTFAGLRCPPMPEVVEVRLADDFLEVETS